MEQLFSIINWDNLPIDAAMIMLVLFSGIFQRKYLSNLNISSAWKTLLISFAFCTIYGVLMLVSGAYMKGMVVKWFFSYVFATSCYELLFKKLFSKLFKHEKP